MLIACCKSWHLAGGRRYGPCEEDALKGRMIRAVASLGKAEVADIIKQEGKLEVWGWELDGRWRRVGAWGQGGACRRCGCSGARLGAGQEQAAQGPSPQLVL